MLPKLTKISVAAVAAAAAFSCAQANAASLPHSNSKPAHRVAAAAAPAPQGCQRKEGYGSPGWWSAIQGCLATSAGGNPVVKVENDCQYKGVLAYSKVVCVIRGHYSVSKDGQVLQEGTIFHTGDPLHGGGTIHQYPYTCAGAGTYTLRLTDLSTAEVRPGYVGRGSGPVPDITVVAAGC
ncbi:hypothetical protein OG533_39255 [Streptomyces sp. NBC_01186]|uniref:hypothetical protein n=1 Tax=unclassified Streptomyces TaxID=2593676 RepID=UPI002DDBDDD9|nr:MULTISPECIES: hypothetical protein [unclassified Streptomyces]WSB74345.1 hypothetical protein OHB04_00135 [Streptomyces sp. NBC_01775]WSS17274.1 hypothetical protein OG533_39255 [Streptomyces sp. NBC_01186]